MRKKIDAIRVVMAQKGGGCPIAGNKTFSVRLDGALRNLA